MKKSFLTLCILQTSILAIGQEQNSGAILNKNTSFEQKSKKIGVAFQVSNPSTDDINVGWFNVNKESIDNYNLKRKSYSLGITLNYNIKEETIIRFRLGFTNYFIEEYNNQRFAGVQFSTKGLQTKFHFAPGIVWKMSDKKFTFIGGFEIPINIHGIYTLKGTVYDNTFIEPTYKVITALPRGYSFGIGALIGFNYTLASWLSVGAEFSPSLLNAKLSGKTKTVNQLGPYTFETNDENKGYFFYEQRFSVNLSVWF